MYKTNHLTEKFNQKKVQRVRTNSNRTYSIQTLVVGNVFFLRSTRVGSRLFTESANWIQPPPNTAALLFKSAKRDHIHTHTQANTHIRMNTHTHAHSRAAHSQSIGALRVLEYRRTPACQQKYTIFYGVGVCIFSRARAPCAYTAQLGAQGTLGGSRWVCGMFACVFSFRRRTTCMYLWLSAKASGRNRAISICVWK